MRGLIDIVAGLKIIGCQRGATAIEYGLIISLIVIAMISALNSVADKTTRMWNNVSTEVTAH